MRAWAAGAAPRDAIPDADRPLAKALELALPTFEHHWWPAHDARNRPRIESVFPTLGAVEEQMITRFDAAYGGSWPDMTIPLDLATQLRPIVGEEQLPPTPTPRSAPRDGAPGVSVYPASAAGFERFWPLLSAHGPLLEKAIKVQQNRSHATKRDD